MADEPDLLEFMRAQFNQTNNLAFEREQRAGERFDKIDARLERLVGVVEALAETVAGLDATVSDVAQHVTNSNTAHARTARELGELRSRVEELERRLPHV